MAWLSSLGRKTSPAGLETQDLRPSEVPGVPAGPARELKEIILMRPGDTVLPSSRNYGGAWTMQRAVKQAYERVTWVYRAIEALSGSSSRLPIGREKNRGPGATQGASETIDFAHPVFELLNGTANPVEHGKVIRKRLAAQLLMSPRGAFIEVVPARNGGTAEIRLLPPGQTEPVPNGAGNLDHFTVTNLQQTEKTDIDAERVRWFRNPHPDSPWRSMTPLEAAGLTIELDYFTRVSARSFAINDGRPGIVIGVKGDITDDEADRVERKFSGGGPTAAGRTTVLSGDLTAVDMSTTPREADYQQTRIAGRDEILAAFGTPLSVIGDASNRTFDNADAEEWNFWTITMPGFLDLLETPWYADVGDGWLAKHDLSGVEVLQRSARQREDRLLALWNAGLITADEFREGTGRPAFERPSSSALWIPGGRYAIPKDDEDLKWLSQVSAETEPAPELPPAPPGAPDTALAPDGSQEPAQPQDGGTPPAPDNTAGGPIEGGDAGMAALAAAVDSAFTSKALAVMETKAAQDDAEPYAPLEDALASVVAQMTDAVADRLGLVNVRRGTPYWKPAGSKRLDAALVVQPDRWVAEAVDAARPLIEQAVADALDGIDQAAVPETKADPAQPPTVPPPAAAATKAAVDAGVAVVREGIEAEAKRLTELVAAQTATGAVALAAVVVAAKRLAEGLESTARAVGNRAGQVAAGTATTARAKVLRAAGLVVERKWTTRGDTKVRPTHRAAEGQVRRPGTPFDVGGAKLLYPGDPAGPAAETINCRCRAPWQRRHRGTP